MDPLLHLVVPLRPVVLLTLACFVLPALLGTGLSEDGLRQGDDVCVPRHFDGIGPACLLPNGLYEMHHDDGFVALTHGPDPIPPGGDDLGTDSVTERHPRCATDAYQHVLYGRPANAPDAYARSVDLIRTSMHRMNALLDRDALESGGVTADYKVLCDEFGRVRVDSFEVPTNTNSFFAIVSAARDAGFYGNQADFTIFYDMGHDEYCGFGHISYDARPGAENDNNRGNDYGVTYRNCWNGRTPQHENGHNQGAVQPAAPMSDGRGHCREGDDVMCYGTDSFLPGTGFVLPLCTDRLYFDCNHDTYFDAHPEPDGWLGDHWNIGSRVNRFISFGDTDDPVPPNGVPTATFDQTLDGTALTVDASASSDPDGDPLVYEWRFGDGTITTGATTTHEYAGPGEYTITLTVGDGKQGGYDTTRATVLVLHDIEPRIETHHHEGTFGCTVTVVLIRTADQCADGVHRLTLPIDIGASGIRVALEWPADHPGGVLGAREMSYYWTQPAGLPGGEGPSPLVGEHAIPLGSQVNMHGGDAAIEVRPAGASGLVKDQSYTLCVTVLYGDVAWPDASVCTT